MEPTQSTPLETTPSDLHHHCVVCGKGHPAAIVLPSLPQLELESHWRCHACYREVSPSHLHCSHCGNQEGNHYAARCIAAYRDEAIHCSCVLYDSRSAEEGLRDIWHVVLAYLCCLLPVLIGLRMAVQNEELPVRVDMILSCILYGTALLFAVYNWRLILPLLKPPCIHRVAALVVPVLAAPVTVALAYMQLTVFPLLADYWVNYSDAYLLEGYGWAHVFFWIAVAPAIFEELMFRGVILQRLLRVMTDWQAILVSAAAFGILHLAVIGMVFYLVPMALVAGWLAVRTRSLLPAILLHFLHNGTIIALEWSGL